MEKNNLIHPLPFGGEDYEEEKKSWLVIESSDSGAEILCIFDGTYSQLEDYLENAISERWTDEEGCFLLRGEYRDPHSKPELQITETGYLVIGMIEENEKCRCYKYSATLIASIPSICA